MASHRESIQPTWLLFLSRKCQYKNLSEPPVWTLPNLTPASRAQRITWGCCSYFLLPKLSSDLGLFHWVIVDAKTSQVRAKSQLHSGSKNKNKWKETQRKSLLGQPLSKAPLKHMCTANTYETPDFSKWLNKFTDMTHSIAMSKLNQF